ncbi:biotin--[acetyl-CoA-carboxylase] ligase [Herbiconiux sp. KACC 21604]|uniref:biotin--[acetyl-CoA-carboxylase] ligase n=1 Tax=unclassified Herbiconiux TaxID=2618217 RepID=UPI0014911AD7|nr:biotin--[acetyl-CoA-carboxylase] ligase [Herbiconiux sp. SALV-R1]QJU54455.1 biotin--[acetyl-CoA-carboxylase] ligase [Herbiconiux sp. SALV-R1]WPO85533.1 biotin--[acetyl-CoA-carboxylase] ligase [Herbiconiux sp. KACC 21604]
MRTPKHPSLPLSEAVAEKLVWLPQAGSTNEVLVGEASGASSVEWPDLAVVATDDQVAGKGRLGRGWTAPAGKCLAVSVLVRPGAGPTPVSTERWGAVPLIAGVAMARVVGRLVASARLRSSHALAALPVGLKWPNDVLIGEEKVCGILGELLPDASGLVIGAGVNLTLTADELPTATATSLALAGVDPVHLDSVLAGYLEDFAQLYARWTAHGGDAVASGLIAEAARVSATLGRAVRVELPGGVFRTGTARELDADGRLVIDLDDTPEPLIVAAGDVTHLRHAP